VRAFDPSVRFAELEEERDPGFLARIAQVPIPTAGFKWLPSAGITE
jgi:hypothetical protein